MSLSESSLSEKEEEDDDDKEVENMTKDMEIDDEKDPEMLLSVAISCKESGNKEFAEQRYDEACKFYIRGLESLNAPIFEKEPKTKKKKKKVVPPKKAGVVGVRKDDSNSDNNDNNVNNEDDDDDDEALNSAKFQSLKEGKEWNSAVLSLNLNMAAIALKRELHQETIFYATQAIACDQKSAKALYRRGMAYTKQGMLEEAKQDFSRILEFSPDDKLAMSELLNVRKRIAVAAKEERERFKNAFAKASEKGLYDDKEKLQKAAEAKRRQERIAREAIWEAENKRRQEIDEEPLSFEAWETQEKQNAEEKKKLAAEKKKEEERLKEEERNKSRSTSNSNNIDAPSVVKKSSSKMEDDDLDLDEEDIKAINEAKALGYNHHFSHTNKNKEKLKDQHVPPPRIDETTGLQVPQAPVKLSASEVVAAASSAWNKGGTTWEERDVSEWAKGRIKSLILEIPHVKNVGTIDGDCQIVVSAGKRRNIWDMCVKKIECEIPGENGEKPFKINFTFREIASSVSLTPSSYSYEVSKYPEMCDIPGTYEHGEKLKMADIIREKIGVFISELSLK